MFQQPDGTLGVRVPASVRSAFDRECPAALRRVLGTLEGDPDRPTLTAPGGFGLATAGALPGRCRIEVELLLAPETRAAGLWLRGDPDGERGYYLRIEPSRGRLVFDRWPRIGDAPFAAELERPLSLAPGEPVRLAAYIDASVCEVYTNERVALSCRLYDHPEGEWGIFVSDGSVTVRDRRLAEATPRRPVD